MDTRPELDVDGTARAAAVETKGQARRRLLRASLGAAPVVLSISSGPAIAGAAVKTASAKCSASLSAPTRGTVDCNGKSHYKWCLDACDSTKNDGKKSACKPDNGSHGWPCYPTTKHFGTTQPQVWSTCGESWSPTGDHYQVMNRHCARAGTVVDKYWSNKELNVSPSSSPSMLKLAAHCSAALLSCQAGLIPDTICDQAKVRQIWEACKTGTGTWMPSNSTCAPWNLDEACAWLNSMCTA